MPKKLIGAAHLGPGVCLPVYWPSLAVLYLYLDLALPLQRSITMWMESADGGGASKSGNDGTGRLGGGERPGLLAKTNLLDLQPGPAVWPGP